jgi:hypothetical protein
LVTARDVADWLLTELLLEGALGPLETAEELEDLFGPGVFTVNRRRRAVGDQPRGGGAAGGDGTRGGRDAAVAGRVRG